MASSPINRTQNELFTKSPSELETRGGALESIKKVEELFKFSMRKIVYTSTEESLTSEGHELYSGVKVGSIVRVDDHCVLHKLMPKGNQKVKAHLLTEELLQKANFHCRLVTPEEAQVIKSLRWE